MKKLYRMAIHTPIGKMEAVANDESLMSLKFIDDGVNEVQSADEKNEVLQLLSQEIKEYFAGNLREFSVKCDASGTEFQQRAWNVLSGIPYGETVCYAEQAAMMGSKAMRAVGTANKINAIGIVIPCHRVINKSGIYGKYNAGSARKQWLIEHERCVLGRFFM